MSRIGKQPVPIAKGVTVNVSKGNLVTVKGTKGELSIQVDPNLTLDVSDTEVIVNRPSDDKRFRAMHGLYRSLINNLVVGVSEGFKKELEIIGVGYRASINGNILELALGYSHPFFFLPPDGISIEVDTKSSKNPRIIITGADKQLVGQVAAKIRSLRSPEPYKGKGVRYLGEQVRKKAGKSAGR
ncbi:MAG: LSU ribosomal protein L6 RplF [Bacteroidetes bacterium HLUCCA01]|nr:MAG: LSU ribosomal protein L6 RplF [Bacteroidetes bacterium HLUCCA01]